ncbi:MAG TPA: hypothetical protein EYM36_10830 [Acidobacteria bacterium]|nr:hypothetical protein [Acidobacteriota bacterium]
MTRRDFLTACLAAGGSAGCLAAGGPAGLAARAGAYPLPPGLAAPGSEGFPWRRFGDLLRARFRDLRRHFVFDYYPWYAADPFRHWTQWDRVPPVDLAANTMPLLGPYDSRSRAVVEQHARWIAESGVGVINMSWWGQGSFSDRTVPLVMDVMADHDIHVTFHLEPYSQDRVSRFPDDALYLLRQYGERRRWDCFFFHERDDGSQGPVFKLFRTTLPQRLEDCHGVVRALPDYVPDREWRRETDRLRQTVVGAFDHLTLLSDTWDAERVAAAGLDGISVYDPVETPDRWLDHALVASRVGMVFSFPINPGLDEIERRVVEPGSCYSPRPFLPRTSDLRWSRAADRETARALAEQRTEETLQSNLLLQTHPWLGNVDKGFFLVHITSFNEWHEGHQYEPMKDDSALTPAERAIGYHNPEDGAYRLRHLADLLARL